MSKAQVATVYTDEVRAEMKAVYSAAGTDAARAGVVTAFANRLGKSPASIRGVMTRAQYYVKKAYVNKKGEKAVKKAELVSQIARMIGVTEDVADSLEKANQAILKAVIVKIATLENDLKAATQEDEAAS